MSQTPEMLPALRELGERLEAAARSEAAPPVPRRTPRRSRSSLVFAAFGLLVVAAAAGAAGLIAVGEPLPEIRDVPGAFAPAAARTLTLRVADPAGGLPWGVAIYEGATGEPCATAGRARGNSLGEVSGGRFRPYAADRVGACGDLTREKLFYATASHPGRTLVFGRVRPGVRSLTAEGRSVELGRGGSFLLVYEGSLKLDDVQLVAR